MTRVPAERASAWRIPPGVWDRGGAVGRILRSEVRVSMVERVGERAIP